MSTTLYPGIPFSPQAFLTNNIGAADTIIEVSDISAFPAAPNLATIGTDEDGETILYAAKTATALSGCTRGVEGTAQAWQSGATIARNWTAKDHADLIAAVGAASAAAQSAKDTSDPVGTATATVAAHNGDTVAHPALFAVKQDKLTGQPGRVVGFGADGAAQAVQGWSNPNLLLNWDFQRPVNRNGKAEYYGANGIYTIDRWKFYLWHSTGVKLNVVNGGIVLSSSTEDDEPNTCSIVNKIPSGLVGVNITLSAIVETDTPNVFVAIIYGTNEPIVRSKAAGSGVSLITVTTMIADNVTSPHAMIGIHGNLAGKGPVNIAIKAVKLELGSHQTLAHQDADGNWVLNDPPDYDLQYALCSLYSPITGEWVGSQHSNPNLLDNWYFADTVNQRGQTEYTGAGYGIDRWKSTRAESVQKIEDGGWVIHDTDGGLGQYRQIIEEATAKTLNGVELTMSVLVDIRTADVFEIGFFSSAYHASGAKAISAGTHIVSYTGTMNDITSTLQFFISPRATNAKVIAAKLELGPVQTLAHQDADGNWILNDPPPNKALELEKCQRYYQVFATEALRHTKAADFRPPMRATPALSTIEIDGVTCYTADANL